MTKRGVAIWLAIVLVLSLISRRQIGLSRSERCDLDGNRIEPIHRVDLMQEEKAINSFCCISCAREWPDVPNGAHWRVFDEMTGEPLDATVACFVQSRVVTIASRQDRYHVFREWSDALQHCAEYDGVRVVNPLAKDDDVDVDVVGD